MSPALAAQASGRPWWSHSRWSLEPGLPRSVGFGPVLSPSLGADRLGVDGGAGPVQQGASAQLIQDRAVDPGPQAHPGPGLEPAVGGGTGDAEQAVGLLPGAAGGLDEQHRGQHGSLIHTRSAGPRRGRQERLDDRPEPIGQHITHST